MLKHRGKEKIKAQFTVTFHGIKKIDKKLNGSTVYIEWKRSSKPGCNGITKRALVTNSEANWPSEPVTFSASFYKDRNSDKLDKKLLQFTLVEDVLKNQKQKPKPIFKIGVDLSPYAKKHNSSETITIPCKKDKDSKDAPILKITFKCVWLKINNKVLVKADEATSSSTKDETVEIEGSDYILRTDSNASESTMDTMSVVSELERDDDFETDIQDNKNFKDEDIENELRDKLRVIANQEKELDFLRQQLEKLKQENKDKIKTIASQEQQLEDLKTEIESSKQSSPKSKDKSEEKLKERIKQLRAQNEEKESALMLAEEEIEKLKKQLELYKSGSESDFRSKFTTLQAEVESKAAIIDQLEHDIKKLKKSKSREEEEVVERKQTSTSSSTENADSLKQIIEENALIEKNIFSAEPQYTNNISNSASTIFRTLLAWKAFNHPRSKFLPKLSETFEIIIKHSRNDVELSCFWMSTITSLLYRISKEKSNLSTFKNYDGSSVTKFENSLTSSIRQIYANIVNCVNKDIEPYLLDAVLYQRAHFADRSRAMASQVPLRRINKMTSLLAILTANYEIFKRNFMPDPLQLQIFVQIFYYMDSVLFNELLDRKDLCTSSNGFQMKLELSQIEDWVVQKPAALHKIRIRDELSHISQAATLLVMDKENLGEKQLFEQVCPSLNISQIKHLIQSYTPDQLSPDPIPAAVVKQVDDIYSRNRASMHNIRLDSKKISPLNLNFISSK